MNKTDNKCFSNLSKQGGRAVRVVLVEEVVHTDYLTHLHTPLQAIKIAENFLAMVTLTFEPSSTA